MIPYGRQSISEADIAAVEEVLRSDFLTQGQAIPRFEKAVSHYCGAEHGVAVNSATSALHIACLALGVGPGDLVWTSATTFVASANCARYCGAEVDFVDIDPTTFNMSVEALEGKLLEAETEGRLPKVVIPVHMCGQSADMREIGALAERYGFRVIEDASHAIGGSYRNRNVGACEFSDICVFSFHPVKIVTTGEGGLATTNNPDFAQKMQLLRSHGVTRQPKLLSAENPPPWYYEQIDLGFNYRMTDIQAALGTSQIERLNEFVDKRHAIADRYDDMLGDLPVVMPRRLSNRRSALHLYVIRLETHKIEPSHRDVFEALRAGGIGVNLHYMPVYLQPDFRKLGFEPGLCPEAEKYANDAISIPMYPALGEDDQREVVEVLTRILSHGDGSGSEVEHQT
ncbi:MAG: UDP-4-amino-4,6-dideoxy-N-acetyl-beta-L-altrosamine transaminase [Pseudomonadota bacterium]